MASIDSGSGHGGRKAMNQEIPLIPFIDLLLCCVMFLLATAVWARLEKLETATPGNAPPEEVRAEDDAPPALLVRVGNDAIVVSSIGEHEARIPRLADGRADLAAVTEEFGRYKEARPSRRAVEVRSEPGVVYRDLVAVMDVAVGAGFSELSLAASY